MLKFADTKNNLHPLRMSPLREEQCTSLTLLNTSLHWLDGVQDTAEKSILNGEAHSVTLDDLFYAYR